MPRTLFHCKMLSYISHGENCVTVYSHFITVMINEFTSIQTHHFICCEAPEVLASYFLYLNLFRSGI